MNLASKHILITGGSSGIGRQCAVNASRLGAKVTIVGRNEDELSKTISMMSDSIKHSYYVADLSVVENIGALVDDIVENRGSIDGFCHAAGIMNMRPLKMTSVSYVEKMFKIHSIAYIELVRSLSLKSNLNDGASIVGITSASVDFGTPTQIAYAASKGAMDASINSLKKYFFNRCIRVNNVSFANVGDNRVFESGLITEDSLKSIQPLGLIDYDSAANAVIFLLSDYCKYIDGEVLHVNAGM